MREIFNFLNFGKEKKRKKKKKRDIEVSKIFNFGNSKTKYRSFQNFQFWKLNPQWFRHLTSHPSEGIGPLNDVSFTYYIMYSFKKQLFVYSVNSVHAQTFLIPHNIPHTKLNICSNICTLVASILTTSIYRVIKFFEHFFC